VVTAIQRGYLQRDGREIVEYDLPGGQGLHRGLGLHVALAAVADLDFARRFTILGRQVAEIRMLGFTAKRAVQPRHLPPRGTAAAAQPTLPLEPPELRQRWPRPAHGAIAFPPRRRHLRRQRATAGLEEGERGYLSYNAQRRTLDTHRPGESLHVVVILTDGRFEQRHGLERPGQGATEVIDGGELEHLAEPAVQDTPAHRDL